MMKLKEMKFKGTFRDYQQNVIDNAKEYDMRKRFLTMLSLFMVGALVACGSKDEAAEEISGEALTATVEESEDAADLTQEELDAFTELFDTSEYDGFLVRPFNSVDEIEWGEVFYNGAGIEATDVTEEEREACYKAMGIGDGEEFGDLVVLRAADVKKFVEEHAGADYEDVKNTIYADYLEEYDSFYSLHGDTNWMSFTCKSGKKLDDTYVLQLSNDSYVDEPNNWEYPDIEVTLIKNGDVYKMVSNVWAWEVGNDPSQTFDINVPGHDTPGRLITYQGTAGDGNGAHIIITADGKRVDWLGTWYWDNDNMAGDFVTIDAIGIFDYTADGAGGIGEYEYAPRKNCIRYYNSDYAGYVGNLNFLSIHDDKIQMDYYCATDNYDDLNGNGYPDEDETTEEALANAKGSVSYSAGDKSLSQSEIEKRIDELQKNEFESLGGKYDSVEFYSVIDKF
ncbi:hypothetical protein [Pseudobutyrivibrio xylanivorans]|uniref:Uncharacterized protein n=1 Tax=Pseudobutyrivibrio xylanivorans TaxID=185007 RepID=A0A5P6VPS2_PSEXY|nr:hypothetical protein [Pseudobutyrivibrio xylanivorans]QFJ53679.1 hypothetical protein FXF36_01755 [Pseudobutyrivibrio xylanivorans]